MSVFVKFDEIPSMTLQAIKETKRHAHTFVRSFVRSFVCSDKVKTVYPPTNTVCGGYKYDGPASPVLHTKVQENQSTASGEKIFKDLNHIWAWQPSWSCDQHHINTFSFTCT